MSLHLPSVPGHRIRFAQLAIVRYLLSAALVCLCVSAVEAQILETEHAPGGPRYGEPDSIRYRVGAEITAKRGPCRNILATVAVPLNCPEQQVEVLSEDFSPGIGNVTYRDLQGGVRQMLIAIPVLPNGATATASVTFKVTTRPILPPESTDQLAIPKKVPNDMRAYLNASPEIETRNRTIVALSRETQQDFDDMASDWSKIEKIYDTVLDKVTYVDGPDISAVEALRDGKADCQGRSMLFIALCRANKIPARMVWVDGHAYPEFYLEESEGHGWWFPCESAGTRAFGEMPLARTILQKGDNFRVPERPTERLRYASDYMIGVPAVQGAGQPSCHFIRETLGR